MIGGKRGKMANMDVNEGSKNRGVWRARAQRRFEICAKNQQSEEKKTEELFRGLQRCAAVLRVKGQSIGETFLGARHIPPTTCLSNLRRPGKSHGPTKAECHIHSTLEGDIRKIFRKGRHKGKRGG